MKKSKKGGPPNSRPKPKPRPRVDVVQPEGEEITPKILAEAIVKISEGFQRLKRSGLNRRGIVVLIRDASSVGISDINAVLNAQETLAERYTRK